MNVWSSTTLDSLTSFYCGIYIFKQSIRKCHVDTNVVFTFCCQLVCLLNSQVVVAFAANWFPRFNFSSIFKWGKLQSVFRCSPIWDQAYSVSALQRTVCIIAKVDRVLLNTFEKWVGLLTIRKTSLFFDIFAYLWIHRVSFRQKNDPVDILSLVSFRDQLNLFLLQIYNSSPGFLNWFLIQFN